MEILTFGIGILGVALMAYLAFRQMRLAARQVGLATAGILEDRKERAAQRENRRASLLTALKAELQIIRVAADADLNDFEGTNLSHPRIVRQGAARDVEGRERYRVSFPWTPLPDTAIQEAIREADLLDLTATQIQKLLELRARIQRINSLVLHKASVYPALMLASVPRSEPLVYGDRPWAFDKAVLLNNDIQIAARDILADCAEMMKRWESEPSVAQSPSPGRPGRRATGRSLTAGHWRVVAAARERISNRLHRLIRQGGTKWTRWSVGTVGR